MSVFWQYVAFGAMCWFLAGMGWLLIRALEDTDEL